MSAAASTGYVVVVEFIVRSEFAESFHAAIIENAAASLRDEQNCEVFDVCRDSNRRERFYLYEVYASNADFDFHLKTPHFLSFHETVRDWVAEKKVETFERVSSAKKGQL
ncbi:putative quinol monooxygenase [Rhizobium bangladeshense]|uniref:putative quinol monooxygenase n=1 Tax=Rhizobium bangladeshense TaxID=1138189 RepID=UPI001C834110|nr:putative quinol monooxygenase [Rhizobium bangladeshense]MBX4901206.1 antibiotic biosynthesis monooxygenase [Rhizobium bangladeshense]MBX4915294.1 antibiotic biosynthesis monooxygenase [Rhizobium bangladeshense]MBX4922202.1 antibiotic biosynthesis monooxygenase [Rhizobium bangladeshense]MBY3599403.1 antibiotic biosynthesis monooxygenase [Rhizobium bangladeshense]